jgi:metal-dependent amidase/aminoacylase/carboxypeptidase family protein
MDLKRELTKKIVEEIDFAVTSMEREIENPFKQLYFFSIPPGAFVRAANFTYDRSWIFAHFVLQSAYQTVKQRFDQMAQKIDRHTELDESLMQSLIAELKKLRERVTAAEDFTDVLERVSEIAYATTGNGTYQRALGNIDF